MRAKSIPDLLGFVPAALGFHPRRSLVAMALHGKRFGFRLRVDLPATECVEACADYVMGPLLAAEPDAVILFAYVEPELNADTRGVERLAADSLVGALRTRLEASDIEVPEAVRCDGSRYWSYVCEREDCCPSEGTPYDIESSATLAAAVFNGLEVLQDRADLERRFEPVSGARAEEMEAVTDRVAEEILSVAGLTADDEGWGREVAENPDLVRAAATGVRDLLADLDEERAGSLSDEDAARLSIWTLLLSVRDLAWSYIEHDNAHLHLQVWTTVAQRAVDPFRAPALCLAAFSSWLGGNGTGASVALEQAARAEPDYSLGLLLRDLLVRCVPPSAWRTFDPEVIASQLPDGFEVRQRT